MVMRLYRFGEYVIKVYESDEEMNKTQLEGFRSLCPNKVNKPKGIEVVGEGFKPKQEEWVFCHLINAIDQVYKLILEEVK